MLSHSQTFDWGLGVGGTNVDLIEAIAVDANLNTYVTGGFLSQNLDFDPS